MGPNKINIANVNPSNKSPIHMECDASSSSPADTDFMDETQDSDKESQSIFKVFDNDHVQEYVEMTDDEKEVKENLSSSPVY